MNTEVKELVSDAGDGRGRTKHRLHVSMLQAHMTNEQVKDEVTRRFLEICSADLFRNRFEDMLVIVSANVQAPYENKNADVIIQFYSKFKDRGEVTEEMCIQWCSLTKLFLERQPYLSFMDRDAHYLAADCENIV